jgi:LysM repeat protein
MELVKENIEYEQLLGENSANNVIQEEYIIPDTKPDVLKILMVDAKPSIINKEVMQDKVYLEGQIEFDVLYLGKMEDNTEVCGVSYSTKFTNYIEAPGTAFKMMPEAECYVEHMNCTAINERKIAVEGIIELKSQVFKQCNLDLVKDVSGLENVQFLKNTASVDKVVSSTSIDLVANSHMQISMDKPQIENIMKCDLNIHKKQIKILEDKIQMEAFLEINLLYKGKGNRDLIHLVDDVLITQQQDFEGINSSMNAYGDFKVDAMEYNIKEDDLGEKRIFDLEALVKVDIKIIDKVNIDVIEDAYSPEINLKIEKQGYDLGLIFGHSTVENIVKENIEFKEGNLNPQEIITSIGKISITDKKIVEDKVVVEGIINASVIYKTGDEERYLDTINEDVPFNCALEIPGCKIDMTSIANAFIESLEASIEANTIALKALVSVSCRVNHNFHKAFLKDIVEEEGEKPKKKASVTIYSTQVGDTLWKIAKMYNTTIESIEKINNIENPDNIMPGEKFIIPGRAVM